MIEISISRELAAENPAFLMGCAERGHQVQVFGAAHEPPESDVPEARHPDDRPDARAQSFAGPVGPATCQVKRR